MINMVKGTERGNSKFDFTYLKNKLDEITLPSTTWGYTKGNAEFFGLQKMENDCSIRKRVAVLSNMHVEIYVDNKIAPLTQFIIIVSLDHFMALLKGVDEMPLPDR